MGNLTSDSLTVICTQCGHRSGQHSAPHVKYRKCCEKNCSCQWSANDVIDNPGPPPPTQLDRIEEKLDTILNWLTAEKLQAMERDLQ